MKKVSKEVIVSLLLFVMVLSLVACQGTNTPSDATTGSNVVVTTAQEKITLDFPSWQATEPGFADFWVKLIEDFKAKHPNVTINLYQVPYSGYVDTLVTRFSSNTPPDICHIPTAFFDAFYGQGWFDTLDDRFATTDILKKWTPLQSTMQREGKNYGLLLMGYGYSMFYNEKIFSDANVDVPTDMESFVAAARALTKDTNNDGNIDQFGWGTCSITSPSLYYGVSALLIGNGSHWTKGDTTELNFDDPLLLDAVATYKSMYSEKLIPMGLSIEQMRSFFFEGKIGMIFDGPWVYAMKSTAPAELQDSFKIARVPFKRVVGAASNSMHIPVILEDSKKDLVWDFISQITTDEYQVQYAKLTNSTPPKSGILTDEFIGEYPQFKFFTEAAAEAVNNVTAGYQSVHTEFSKIIVDGMVDMVTNNLTPETALKKIEETIKRDIDLP